MKIFIDTSVFICLFIQKEIYHKEVVRKYREYQEQRVPFFTSYYVLAELFTRLTYDFGKRATEKAVYEIYKSIESKALTVLDIEKTVFKKSTQILLKFSEHKISFTDATTYVLYKDFALDEVFTLDSDFRKIGVKTAFNFKQNSPGANSNPPPR